MWFASGGSTLGRGGAVREHDVRLQMHAAAGPVDDEIHESESGILDATEDVHGEEQAGGVAEEQKTPKPDPLRVVTAHDGRKRVGSGHGRGGRRRMRKSARARDALDDDVGTRAGASLSAGRWSGAQGPTWERASRRMVPEPLSLELRRIQRASASGSRASVDNGSGAASTAASGTSAMNAQASVATPLHARPQRATDARDVSLGNFQDRRMRPQRSRRVHPGARAAREKLTSSNERKFYQSSTRTESPPRQLSLGNGYHLTTDKTGDPRAATLAQAHAPVTVAVETARCPPR